MPSISTLTCLIVVSFWVAVRHGKWCTGNKTGGIEVAGKRDVGNVNHQENLAWLHAVAPAAKAQEHIIYNGTLYTIVTPHDAEQ